MTRCTITVKKEGGNILSNSHNVTAILFLRAPSSSTFSTLEHISLKKQDKSIKLLLTLGGKDPRIAIGKSCCIKMWLSWLFIPLILRSLSLTQREMFEEYPSKVSFFIDKQIWMNFLSSQVQDIYKQFGAFTILELRNKLMDLIVLKNNKSK